MLPLFDMLAKAQGGQGMDALARQFNLSREQAQLAVEALLPAFSQGLKRNTADPYGLGAFLTAMASGDHAKYFENAGSAFSAQGVSQGNDVLGQLFGSKDLSRAVAAQAAQATGIGQQVLQQMLPVIASMLMGGLAKQSANQMPGDQAAVGAGGQNPLAEIVEQMMKQAGGMMGGQPAPQSTDPLGDNPFGKVLQDMLGGGSAQQPPQGQDPASANPWGKILQDMLGSANAPSAPQGQEPPGAGEPAKNPYGDIFGKMFETGRQQRDDYQAGMESIFDQFKKGMDRR